MNESTVGTANIRKKNISDIYRNYNIIKHQRSGTYPLLALLTGDICDD